MSRRMNRQRWAVAMVTTVRLGFGFGDGEARWIGDGKVGFWRWWGWVLATMRRWWGMRRVFFFFLCFLLHIWEWLFYDRNVHWSGMALGLLFGVLSGYWNLAYKSLVTNSSFVTKDWALLRFLETKFIFHH